MTEQTTLEIIAPTVEQALAQGLAQLGLPATAVSVEVLDSGNTGLFGLGARQVRVRLTVNPPDGQKTPVPAPAAPSKPTPRNEGRRKEARPAERSKGETRMPAAPVAEAVEPPRADKRPAILLPEGGDEVLDKTEAIVSKLLFHMGLQAQVSAHYGEPREDRRPIMVDVRGTDLAVLIGRRGQTLDAFQYVAALMVGKQTGQFIHLIVDVEGHRDRRERQLRQLAQRMAEQVLKTGHKLTLEPMRASERRIIHMELRDHPAVMTESVGEDPYRKVTIIPKE
ncbi:MAG TPA: RNA-binding cell elongation regulator Jag/EloR [Anaerolineales bacterium]|nr:RNA-binding cell elongation regulator Jag/EloR [Anaerolineales bacterium]